MLMQENEVFSKRSELHTHTHIVSVEITVQGEQNDQPKKHR